MFQFPANPTPGQSFTPVSGTTYRWSGTAWHLLAGPGSFITQAEGDALYVNVSEVPNIQNRIINGKFAIDQRHAGATTTVSATNVPTLDRWIGWANGVGSIQVFQSPGAFRVGETVMTAVVGTADTLANPGFFYMLGQPIEGNNFADLGFGAAGASSFTFAFEVRCTIAGTFALSFRDGAGTRSYVTTFTVAANVLTPVVITVPGDTVNAGAWGLGPNLGIQAYFALGVGSTLQTSTTNTWLAGNFVTATGCTNLMATASANIRFANVRLYKGSVDFGPDRRLYAEELALCQRYYEKSYAQATVPGALDRKGQVQFNTPVGGAINFASNDVHFRVEKRAVPTIVTFNPDVANAQIRNEHISADFTATATFVVGETGFSLAGTAPASSVAGQIAAFHFTASAEL